MQAIVSNFRSSFSLYLSVYHIIHMCVCLCVCVVSVWLRLMHSFRIVFRCEVLWSNLAISKYSMFIFELLCTRYSWICYVRSAFSFQCACYTDFVIFSQRVVYMFVCAHMSRNIEKELCKFHFSHYLSLPLSPLLPCICIWFFF